MVAPAQEANQQANHVPLQVQLPGTHRAFDARGNLCCAPTFDPIFS